MARVVLEKVGKRYADGFVALQDVDLEVEDGEFLILVGPSGCGKSTTLRMIAGLEDITEGTLRIGDRDATTLAPKDRDVAMVFQSYALYPQMTVAENLGFALKLAKVDKAEIAQRVREAAELLDLNDHLDRRPATLSGGQRQRVAMGRAIVRQPSAYLMDEPLSNLDAKLRVQMRAEIVALQQRLGVTTIYVTHDQVEAMTMGHRVAVLRRGVLMQVAPPQELYERPDNLFVATFIGSPAMNTTEAVIRRNGDGLQAHAGEAVLDIGPGSLAGYPGVTDRIDAEVVLGIRPEHLSRGGQGSPGATWPGLTVDLVELLGAEMLLHVRSSARPVRHGDVREAVDDEATVEAIERGAATEGQQLVARLGPREAPSVGDTVSLGVDTDALHFFDLETGTALR